MDEQIKLKAEIFDIDRQQQQLQQSYNSRQNMLEHNKQQLLGELGALERVAAIKQQEKKSEAENKNANRT